MEEYNIDSFEIKKSKVTPEKKMLPYYNNSVREYSLSYTKNYISLSFAAYFQLLRRQSSFQNKGGGRKEKRKRENHR